MKVKKIIFCLALFLILGLILNSKINIYASTESEELHKITKIYSSNNADYFSGCEDYNDYVNVSPTITVLTHGLGSSYYYWSNNISEENGEIFAANEASLIYKIFDRLTGEASLYIADGLSTITRIENSNGEEDVTIDLDFQLIKYSTDDYLKPTAGNITDRLDDVSKHIILVFDSSFPNESNSNVYEEFEFILDTISYQYKQLTGVLPRFNLVGHSRGGITNIMYATEHPYNVASMYSMGTPYSGSTLGQIEALLGFMNYTDGNGVINDAGVQSIMNDDEMKSIRDAWNQAFTADVNMNVVVYGGMTSISLIRAMLEDIETNPDYAASYGAMLSSYTDIINTIINITERNPNLTTNFLNFVDGLAETTESLGINLYTTVLDIFSVDIEGDLTTEEVSAIISLINVINNEFVIMDDLFIDLDSQLGMGFDDNIMYNGFKKYIKIFGAADYTNNKAVASQPGIPHNLEIMNATYINDISSSLVLDAPTTYITTLNDGYESLQNIGIGKGLYFNSVYSGTRKFTAENCNITLYKYTDNNTLTKINTYTNEFIYDYESGAKYLFLVESDSINNTIIKFELNDNMVVGNNQILVAAKEKQTYKIVSDTSGYYMVTINNANITLGGNAISDVSGSYYIYLKANSAKYVYVTNSANYTVSVNVKISEPTEISLHNEFVVDSSKKVMKFTNNYNVSMSYKLKISWTEGAKNAYIYNENSELISSITVNGTEKMYSFTLGIGKSCYIVFSTANSTITTNLYINETQLRWKIDDVIYDTTSILLPRGNEYKIELVIISGESIISYNTAYVIGSDEYFDLSNNILEIYDNALIGYDISIYPINEPDFLLTIEIGLKDNDINWIEENSTEVYISWEDIEDFENLEVTLNNTSYTNVQISQIETGIHKGKFNITAFLPQVLGKTTIHIVSFTFNNNDYVNGENIIINDYQVDNLFESGTGFTNNVYKINCQRHLNNIRYAATEYREGTDVYYYLQRHFVITQSITLTGSWIPIEPSMKSGSIKGIDDSITIYNLNIRETKSSKNIGFIRNLDGGTIENIRFNNANINVINSSNSSPISIGIVVGAALGGSIRNCFIDGESSIIVGTLDDNLSTNGAKYTYTGGICGMGQFIYSCSVDATITSYGDTGGIAGYILGGTLSNCSSSGNLTLLHDNKDLSNDSENKSIGGLVGVAYGVTIIASNTTVSINYLSNEKSTDKELAPRIGGIVGRALNLTIDNEEVSDRGAIYSNIYTGNLQTKNGFLGIGKYDQKKYTGLKIGIIE